MDELPVRAAIDQPVIGRQGAVSRIMRSAEYGRCYLCQGAIWECCAKGGGGLCCACHSFVNPYYPEGDAE